ncbi:MAG TPA: YceI family protein [Azoarcus sp.]|nr:YceI family protein [Azoarcus sp.]
MRLSSVSSFVLAAALGVGMLSNAAAAEYTSLDAQASRITFGYSQMNVNLDGYFEQMQATDFSFDPASPEEARAVIEIPLSSIDAGYEEANAELEKEEWLHPTEHPLATFTSSEVKALEDGSYQVTGDLSIKGYTKTVTAPFTFREEGDTGIFEGQFTFQRADFGVGEGQWKDFSIVANDIQLRFHIVAKP